MTAFDRFVENFASISMKKRMRWVSFIAILLIVISIVSMVSGLNYSFEWGSNDSNILSDSKPIKKISLKELLLP